MGKGIWKALVAFFTGKKPGPTLSSPLPAEPAKSRDFDPAPSRPLTEQRLDKRAQVRQSAKKRHQNRVKNRAAKEKQLCQLPPPEREKQPIPKLDPKRSIESLFGVDETEPPSGGKPSPTRSEPDFGELVERYPQPLEPADTDEDTEAIQISEIIKRYPASQDSLDLHGYKKAQARARCEAFIKARQAKGLFTVTIIVGRGHHSPKGPKLPDAIERELGRLKRDGWVLSFGWEKKRKKGKGKKRKSGALTVYLPQP